MDVKRIPRERVYIDWVDDQPEFLVAPEMRELTKLTSSLPLPVSSMLYAETFRDVEFSQFISGTVHELEYCGTAPEYLVSGGQ